MNSTISLVPWFWKSDWNNVCRFDSMAEKMSTKSTRIFFPLNILVWLSGIFPFSVFSFLRVKVLLIFSIDFPTLANFEEKGSYWLVWSAQTRNVSCTRAIFVEIHRSPWLFPRVDEKKSPIWRVSFYLTNKSCQIRNIALVDDSFHEMCNYVREIYIFRERL